MSRTHLYPTARQGLRLPEARSWRIGVEDGALVERRPDLPARVVGGPGEIARVVLLRGTEVPRHLRSGPWSWVLLGPATAGDEAVAFLGDESVLLVVDVGAFTPAATEAHEGAARTSSGLVDVVRGLGTTLERATTSDVGRVASAGAASTLGPVSDRLARRLSVQLGLLLATLAATVVMVTSPSYENTTFLAAAVTAVAALAALSVDQWVLAARFLRTVGSPRPPTLTITGTDVVVSTPGSDSWAPGPDVGGVVTCDAAADYIFFFDRFGVALATLTPAQPWYPGGSEGDLAAACRRAGIGYQHTDRARADDPAVVEAMAGFDALLPRSLRAAASMPVSTRPRSAMHAVDNGEGMIGLPLLTVIGLALVGVAAGLDPQADRGPVGLAVAVVAAVALVAIGVRTLRLRRWDIAAARAAGQPGTITG